MAEPSRGEGGRPEPSRAPAPGPAARAAARLRLFARDARGGTAIEYAMIGGLIFAVVAGSIRLYGSKVNLVYGQIGNAMAQIN